MKNYTEDDIAKILEWVKSDDYRYFSRAGSPQELLQKAIEFLKISALSDSKDFVLTDEDIEEGDLIMNILNNVLGEEKIKQLINDNQKCQIDWIYTYEGSTRVKLPIIEISFNLVDGKGDLVCCLDICYHTESGKWEQNSDGKMYDTYEQLVEEEFFHDHQYYHDYGVIYL